MANKTLKYGLQVDNLNETVKEFEKLNDNIDESKDALKKPIGDKTFDGMNQDLKEANDSTEKFEAAARKLDGSVKVLTGGVGVAAGVMGAFGAENEKVQETLLKVQSAIAFTTGIKDLTEGFTQLGVAQKAYNFVVGTSTGLMKAFKVALAATGIGLLVTGLALLITNFDKVIEVIEDVVSEFGFLQAAFDKVKGFFVALGIVQSEQAEKAEEYIEKQKELTSEIEKRYDTEIRLARAAGEDTKQLELKKEEAVFNRLGKELSALNSLRDEEGKLSDEQQERFEELQGIREEAKLRQKEITIQINKEIEDKEKEHNDKVTQDYKKEVEKRKKAAQDLFDKIVDEHNRERLASKQLALENAETDEERKNAKISLLNEEMNIRLETEELTASEILLIKKQTQDKIDKLNEDSNKNEIDTTKVTKAEIAVIEANTDEEILEAKVDLINEQRNVALQQENLTAEERKRINAQADAEIYALRREMFVTSLQQATSGFQEAMNNLRDTGIAAFDTFKNVNNEIMASVSEAFITFTDKTASLGEKIAAGLQIAQSAVQGLGSIMQADSDQRLEEINRNRDAELQSLQQQRDAGLITEKQLKDGIENINDKARKKEEKEKKKAFKQQKAISIVEAIIGTAQGVVAGLGAPFPLNIIMPILAGVTGAAQIALISKQKYPEGGSGGGGGGASTPSLSIPETTSADIAQAGGGGGGELVSFTPNNEPSVSGNFIDDDNRQNTNNEKRPPITVAENDISSTQNRVKVIEDDAAFE